MPWSVKTMEAQKLEFIKDALSGNYTLVAACKRHNISRPTGYKWLRRYQEKGILGLQEHSRARKTQNGKTSAEQEQRIVEERKKYSTWGAKKIKASLELRTEQVYPAVSTMNAILKRNGLVDENASLKRQKFTRFERENANDLWQADYKGRFTMENGKRCYPLTIIDDYSRFNLGIKANLNERCDSTKKLFTEVFLEYGLPKEMNFDNGNPWGNVRANGYTRFTIWLMKLGIRVSHSRPRHPQTNGKDERFHRTLKEDVLALNTINNITHAQQLFDTWREIYNLERPHEAIGLVPPSTRYQKSQRELPEILPDIVYDEGAIVRKVKGNGFISFNNEALLVGEAFVGEYVEIKPEEENQILDIYFGRHKVHSYDKKEGQY